MADWQALLNDWVAEGVGSDVSDLNPSGKSFPVAKGKNDRFFAIIERITYIYELEYLTTFLFVTPFLASNFIINMYHVPVINFGAKKRYINLRRI